MNLRSSRNLLNYLHSIYLIPHWVVSSNLLLKVILSYLSIGVITPHTVTLSNSQRISYRTSDVLAAVPISSNRHTIDFPLTWCVLQPEAPQPQHPPPPLLGNCCQSIVMGL